MADRVSDQVAGRADDRAVARMGALVVALTLAAVPWAGTAFAPTHRVLARVLGQGLRLVGHNEWSYAASIGEAYAWSAAWLVPAVLWAAAALRRGTRRPALAGLVAQLLAGTLALAAVALVEWGPAGLAGAAGPGLLRVADLGSPWWSCPAVLLAAAWWEPVPRRRRRPAAAGFGYAVLLATLLATGTVGAAGTTGTADAGWALLLAAVAGVAVLPQPLPDPLAVIRRSRLRVARWMRGSA